MKKTVIYIIAAAVVVACIGVGIYFYMKQDPCKEFEHTTPASQVTPKCLQSIWTSLGCTKDGNVYPADDYKGWWLSDTGAKTFGGIKRDMMAWATLPDDKRVLGCGAKKKN